jgi:hypothetical protein
MQRLDDSAGHLSVRQSIADILIAAVSPALSTANDIERATRARGCIRPTEVKSPGALSPTCPHMHPRHRGSSRHFATEGRGVRQEGCISRHDGRIGGGVQKLK